MRKSAWRAKTHVSSTFTRLGVAAASFAEVATKAESAKHGPRLSVSICVYPWLNRRPVFPTEGRLAHFFVHFAFLAVNQAFTLRPLRTLRFHIGGRGISTEGRLAFFSAFSAFSAPSAVNPPEASISSAFSAPSAVNPPEAGTSPRSQRPLRLTRPRPVFLPRSPRPPQLNSFPVSIIHRQLRPSPPFP